ncbi:hypothetical protein B0H14DRAFT_3166951 [Mycena olivaceomarginata]|nr:hypothetical protein B0H14DRAFT_3166951 [Mycena olivaceomarginata]
MVRAVREVREYAVAVAFRFVKLREWRDAECCARDTMAKRDEARDPQKKDELGGKRRRKMSAGDTVGRASERTRADRTIKPTLHSGSLGIEAWGHRWRGWISIELQMSEERWSEPRATVASDQVNAQCGDPWLSRRSSTPQRVVDVDPRPTPALDRQSTAKEQRLARHTEPRWPPRQHPRPPRRSASRRRSNSVAAGAGISRAPVLPRELEHARPTVAMKHRGADGAGVDSGRSTPSLPERTEGAHKVGSSARWKRFTAMPRAMREARRRSAAVRDWLTQAMTRTSNAEVEAEAEGAGTARRLKAGDTRAGGAAIHLLGAGPEQQEASSASIGSSTQDKVHVEEDFGGRRLGSVDEPKSRKPIPGLSLTQRVMCSDAQSSFAAYRSWQPGIIFLFMTMLKLRMKSQLLKTSRHGSYKIGGSQGSSWMFDSFKDMMVTSTTRTRWLTDKWREEFGPAFKFKCLFSMSELHTSGIKALTHIVNNGTIYRRAPSLPFTRSNAVMLLGKGKCQADTEGSELICFTGLISVELDQRTHQNHVSHKSASLRGSFLRKLFKDIWSQQIALGKKDSQRVDVISGLRHIMLGVIGKAGPRQLFVLNRHSQPHHNLSFNYDFDVLEANGQPSEHNKAFTELSHSPQASRYALARLVQLMIPVLRSLPAPWRAHQNARAKMDGIANQIVMESKANAKLESPDAKRDLVSVLVKANVSQSAGESTPHSGGASRLRGHSTLSRSTLQSSLNYAKNSSLFRQATHPAKSSTHYRRERVYAISKGQMIHIPILAINTDKEIWGEDAREFEPERWESLPDAVSLVPGVRANQLHRAPVLSLSISPSTLRLKALLFTLICAFELEAAVPNGSIRHASTRLVAIGAPALHGSDFLWSNREYMKFPIGSTPPASVDQLWTGGPGEDGAESKKPQPRKRNVFDSDNYIEDDEHDTAEGSYREIWRAEFVRMGELPCVDGVRLESAREVREISVATVESKGNIHAMHEVHGSTFWVKFNHIMGMGSGDGKPVFCRRVLAAKEVDSATQIY